MSNETLVKAVKLLLSEYYIIVVDGIPEITSKLKRELAELKPFEVYEDPITVTPNPVDIIPEPVRAVIPLRSSDKTVILTPGVQQPLVEFIAACEVPAKIRMDNGSFFWANKYNKQAEQELRKILSDGYQLDILVGATKLYYKSGGTCEAVSNYILRGSWLTHYLELEKSLNAGTTEAYIKDNLDTKTEGKPSYQSR